MSPDELAAIRERAEKQSAAYARMLELNGGVGKLGVHEPAMFEDMQHWNEASDNEHADTVLALLAEVERPKACLDKVRALHKPRPLRPTGTAWMLGATEECWGCGSEYPCPTIQAIDGSDQ